MTKTSEMIPLWFVLAAAPALGFAQSNPHLAASPVSVAPAAPTSPVPDRAQAYYHYALATELADEASDQGRADLVSRAAEEFKLALAADPGSASVRLKLAELYLRTGRTGEAESTARDVLKSDPDNQQALKLIGQLFLRQLGEGQSAGATVLDDAVKTYAHLVDLDPKSVESRMILGQLYTVKHDAKKAEDQFRAALSLEPASEQVILNLARLYAERGDIEHAAQTIENVPASDRSPRMEAVLGATYEQLKQPQKAIAAYRRAAEMDPSDTHSLAELAQSELNAGQFEAALADFRRLSTLDPDDVPALVRTAEILRRQGKYQDALAAIRKARVKDPRSLEAGYNEGLLLDVLGRTDEAAAVFEKMVDETSHANGAYTADERNNRGIFLERLAAVYHEQNKVDEAISAYQKLIDMGGDGASRGYQGQVDVYRDAHQLDKAVAAARKGVEANPKDRELKLVLASGLADAGKPDEALTIAHSLLKNNDEDRPVLLAIGQIEVRLKRWHDAEETFAKTDAVTHKKEDRIYLLFLRGEAAERQKHFEQAEAFFRQVLDIDADNAMALNYLGYMLADKGTRLPEALKMIRRAVEMEPTNGAFLDSLGWAYFKLGQFELAETNLTHAVERDRTDPTVHEHLGDLYEKTGRIRLAATEWQNALDQFAKSASADVEPGDPARVQHKLDSARARLAKEERALGDTK